MKKNVLVTLADNNYVNQAKALFSSAYFKGGWDEDFLLLSYEIPEKRLKWFKNKGIKIIRCKRIDPNENIYNKKHSLICINKFYMFTEEFKKWERVIYIDSDILIKSSLSELKKYNGFNATIDPTLKLKNQFLSGNKILSLKYLFKKSYNAGMLVFNTEIIKKNTFNDLKILFFRYKNKIKYSDQTIINIYFLNKIKELPLVYNAYNNIMDKKIKVINHHLIIDSFDKKPWEKGSIYYEEWKKNYNLANKINIDSPKIIYSLTNKEIIIFSKILNSRLKKLYFNEILFSLKENLKKPFRKIERSIGIIGIKIKNKNKRLYYLLGGKN